MLVCATLLLLAFIDQPVANDDTVVRTGIDILVATDFVALKGKRIALLTNHTGIDRDGVSTIRRLHEAPDVDLVRIFSPEHGLHGKLDVPKISDGVEKTTRIPVFSLYGDVRRPTPAMLEGIDTVVFDIQDIGARFYTYISTMGNAMQAAAEHGVTFVVLDRPNPINGSDVGGPVLDDDLQSFVGYHRIPIRHGMTVAELALMFQDELGIDVRLKTIEVEGWQRDTYFDVTGLPWLDPSPNIRNLAEALLYPGIGLLETTNISVGRGTDTPFEIFGAPWLDGTSIANKLAAAAVPGVAFSAARFTPASSTYAGEPCEGVRMTITDRQTFDPIRLGFEVAHILVTEFGDHWDSSRYMRLLGNQETFDAVRKGLPYDEIVESYQPGLLEFIERREKYLLYR